MLKCEIDREDFDAPYDFWQSLTLDDLANCPDYHMDPTPVTPNLGPKGPKRRRQAKLGPPPAEPEFRRRASEESFICPDEVRAYIGLGVSELAKRRFGGRAGPAC